MINEKIPILRMLTIFLLFMICSSFFNFPKNVYGINKLLLSIVDKLMLETTIIEMAAENPPRKTKTVSV